MTLTTTPLAAAAGKASQDISAAPNCSRRSLPAGSTTIEGLGGFGQGQPFAGAHSFVQFAGQVVRIGFCIREEVPCKAEEALGLRMLAPVWPDCISGLENQGCYPKFYFTWSWALLLVSILSLTFLSRISCYSLFNVDQVNESMHLEARVPNLELKELSSLRLSFLFHEVGGNDSSYSLQFYR